MEAAKNATERCERQAVINVGEMEMKIKDIERQNAEKEKILQSELNATKKSINEAEAQLSEAKLQIDSLKKLTAKLESLNLRAAKLNNSSKAEKERITFKFKMTESDEVPTETIKED